MRLHLGGHLDWYDPQKRAWLDLCLDAPLLLTDLLQQLGIPAGEVAIVAVDRRAVPLEGTTVSDGNRVELYPPMGGGAIGCAMLPRSDRLGLARPIRCLPRIPQIGTEIADSDAQNQ